MRNFGTAAPSRTKGVLAVLMPPIFVSSSPCGLVPIEKAPCFSRKVVPCVPGFTHAPADMNVVSIESLLAVMCLPAEPSKATDFRPCFGSLPKERSVLSDTRSTLLFTLLSTKLLAVVRKLSKDQ